jgi:prepilin-type N-terminal cleavage/methylation domain-containing protein
VNPRRRGLVWKGFTLIELMIVVTIVGLLARIAIPRVYQFRLRARATKIVGDLEVVRTAAFHVVADSGYYPGEEAPGTRPPSMQSYLPPGLSFTPGVGVAYVWRVQGIPAGDPNQATEGATMGMGVQVDDDELRVEVQRQLAAQVTMTSGTTVYWLIWGPTIRP